MQRGHKAITKIINFTNRQLCDCLRDNRNLSEFSQIDKVLGSDLEFKVEVTSSIDIIAALPL